MQISIHGFIVARPANTWEAQHLPGLLCSFWNSKPGSDSEYIAVCEHELTFDVPADFDPRPEQIKRLEAQQRDLDAKYAAGSAFIRQQISQLRALEHTEAA